MAVNRIGAKLFMWFIGRGPVAEVTQCVAAISLSRTGNNGAIAEVWLLRGYCTLRHLRTSFAMMNRISAAAMPGRFVLD